MYYDPTGHWGGKYGEHDDSKLSLSAQRKIKKLTDAWFKTKNRDEQDKINTRANEVRENDRKGRKSIERVIPMNFQGKPKK
jgi:hypothetical protein